MNLTVIIESGWITDYSYEMEYGTCEVSSHFREMIQFMNYDSILSEEAGVFRACVRECGGKARIRRQVGNVKVEVNVHICQDARSISSRVSFDWVFG